MEALRFVEMVAGKVPKVSPTLKVDMGSSCSPSYTVYLGLGAALLAVLAAGLWFVHRSVVSLLEYFYDAAFDSADTDKSGYIEANELETIILRVCSDSDEECPIDVATRDLLCSSRRAPQPHK